MRTPIAGSAGATAGPDDGLHEDGLGAVRARMRAVMKFPIIIPAIGTRGSFRTNWSVPPPVSTVLPPTPAAMEVRCRWSCSCTRSEQLVDCDGQ